MPLTTFQFNKVAVAVNHHVEAVKKKRKKVDAIVAVRCQKLTSC